MTRMACTVGCGFKFEVEQTDAVIDRCGPSRIVFGSLDLADFSRPVLSRGKCDVGGMG